MKVESSSLFVALALACAGCTDSANSLAKRARREATAEQWRAWAARVIERDKTNSTALPRSEWPEFVRRTAKDYRPWQVVVSRAGGDSNSAPLVTLLALGGFQSIGVIIGPPSYVENPPQDRPQVSKRVYPGIYVREVY